MNGIHVKYFITFKVLLLFEDEDSRLKLCRVRSKIQQVTYME